MSETQAQLQGAVLHVADLDRAVDFYTRLLDLQLARRATDAAVLANEAGTCTLALRERARMQHATDSTVQALMWRVPTLDMLNTIEQRLDEMGAKPAKHTLAEDTTTLLTATDPHGQRLMLIHHDSKADVPQTIPTEVFLY